MADYKISELTAETAPASTTEVEILISGANKRATLANITKGLDNSVLTEKTTPVDADLIGVTDSATSNILKKLTWANLKATIKTYFDTLYVALTGDQTVAGVKTFSSFPITPSSAPTTDYQAANKKYVDDHSSSVTLPTKSILTIKLSGVTPNGTYFFGVAGITGTIANVRWGSTVLPVGSNRTLDIRKNGTASTNSIFTSDTPMSKSTAESPTNGLYIGEDGTIDNGTLAENDVLWLTFAGGSTSGTADDFITLEIA